MFTSAFNFREQEVMRITEKEKLFKALGDRNRLAIMDLIKEKEMSAGRILAEIKMGQSTLSHHMKILCDSGIVNSRKDSRWVYYSINKEAADDLIAVIKGWTE